MIHDETNAANNKFKDVNDGSRFARLHYEDDQVEHQRPLPWN